jgi:hypothetical protein
LTPPDYRVMRVGDLLNWRRHREMLRASFQHPDPLQRTKARADVLALYLVLPALALLWYVLLREVVS